MNNFKVDVRYAMKIYSGYLSLSKVRNLFQRVN